MNMSKNINFMKISSLLFCMLFSIKAYSLCLLGGNTIIGGNVSLNFPTTVVVQSDMPVGTVIATATASHTLLCTIGLFGGKIELFPSGGNSSQAPIGGAFPNVVPSGIAGIGIRWTNTGSQAGTKVMTDKALNDTSQKLTVNAALVVASVNSMTEKVELIKTGPINAGSQVISIPSIKVLQQDLVSNLLLQDAYTLFFNSISLRNAACTISSPNQNVYLGTITKSSFSGSPAVSSSVTPFTISLTGCSSGTNVNMTLSNANAVGGSYPGTIKLSGGSTAQNVGIQILDNTNTPFALGVQKNIQNNVTTGSVSIPLRARYIKTNSSEVGAGSANGTLDFTITYQ